MSSIDLRGFSAGTKWPRYLCSHARLAPKCFHWFDLARKKEGTHVATASSESSYNRKNLASKATKRLIYQLSGRIRFVVHTRIHLAFTKFSTSVCLRTTFSTSGSERIHFAGSCPFFPINFCHFRQIAELCQISSWFTSDLESVFVSRNLQLTCRHEL